jgi:acyl carrier protein
MAQETVDRAWTAEVIRQVVTAYASVPVELAESAQQLVHDLGYHSLRLVELAFALEDLFVMEPVTLDDPPPIGTVGELAEYMVRRVESGLGTVPTPERLNEFLGEI